MKSILYKIFSVRSILIGIASITFIVLLSDCRKKEKEVLVFPSSVIAHNYTAYENLDTFAMVAMNKVFDIDTLTVNIYYKNVNVNSNMLDVYAFIQKSPYTPHTYAIFVARKMPVDIKQVLAHELVHMYQMETGALEQRDNKSIIFNNQLIIFKDVEYNDRPYEIEAFAKQASVLKETNDLMYK